MRGGLLPPLAATGTGVLVGSAIVATRFAVDQTGPASLALMRYLIGVLCLLPPTLMLARPRFAKGDLAPIALLGIAQFGILIALLNYALQFIPSARAALIFATTPLLTMVFASLVGSERMSAMKAAGVLVTIAGVAMVLGEKALSQSSAGDSWIGELAVLGSAVCGAVCSVLYRPYLRKYPPLAVSSLAMMASVVFLLGLALLEGSLGRLPEVDAPGWLAILFIGVNSGIGYFLWLWALANTTPTKVTVFLALSPLTAALLGTAFLSEPLTPALGVALVLVGLGLWLAHRLPRTPPHA